MLTPEQTELLEVMAQQLEERWKSCPPSEEPDIADIFAKVCQAITQFDQSVDQWYTNQHIFIQIGPSWINQNGRGDIVRVRIEEEMYSSYDEKLLTPKEIIITIRDDHEKAYKFDSPEGQAFLKWLGSHTEVLLPYEGLSYGEPIEE